jgi:peptide-methionine (S)-S-oxide reductase
MKGVLLFLALFQIFNIHGMQNNKKEVATLGGGCFWCLEAVFQDLKGVESVVSGFSGGNIKNPAYREVVAGVTGHAEVVQITFNPEIISYSQLLIVFFSTHDPTTLNRQGADVGTQYRSVVFYHDEDQKSIAESIVSRLTDEKVFQNPIVTELSMAVPFYKAEDYHQNYFKNNPSQPYCQVVINPKLRKFRKEFESLLK